MARRRSFSILAAGLLAASSALALMAGAALAVPTASVQPSTVPGNDGTVKIHDGNSESEPVVNNEPQVCTFHLHFFFADEDQSGDWWIQSWPPTGDGTTVLSGSYDLDAELEYRTPADPSVYSLPDGHYKLFWQGDEENLAKHKVFWVDCPSNSMTPFESFAGETATPDPCASQIIEIDLEQRLLAPADFAPTASSTVAPTATVCQTPFESFLGETSGPNDTPPPTGTAGEQPQGTTPAFVLLLASLFGAFGLAAAQAQRRSLARR